ncbi:MAG: hypothetical protein ABIJ34_04125 [archaeon]
MKPKIECHSLCGLIENPAGADCGAAAVCGYQIGRTAFPFKEISNYKIEFCRRNLKQVEKYCNITVDQVFVDEFAFNTDWNETMDCSYIVLDSEKRPSIIVKLTSFSKSFRESELGKMMNASEIESYEWHSLKTNLPDQCKNLEQNLKPAIFQN